MEQKEDFKQNLEQKREEDQTAQTSEVYDEDQYIKIATMKLNMLDFDYKRTQDADNKVIDGEIQLKGTFSKAQMDNVQYETTEQQLNVEKENISEINSQINNQQTDQETISSIAQTNGQSPSYQSQQQSDDEENEEDTELNNQYQQLDDGNELENDDNWGEFQESEHIEEQEEDKKQEIKLDIERIKQLMAKIDIKVPDWAKDQDSFQSKVQTMFNQK